jgi:hypothetical protein
MSQHLYEITDSVRELQTLAMDGDIPEDCLRDTLEAVGGEFKDKAKQVAFVIQNMGAPIPAIDAQIARLQAMKKSIQSREEWLKNYLLENMTAAGITEIACDLFTLSISKGRESVSVDNMDLLADEYVRVKTDISADKVAIAAAIKAGIAVAGASMVRGSPSLKIK